MERVREVFNLDRVLQSAGMKNFVNCLEQCIKYPENGNLIVEQLHNDKVQKNEHRKEENNKLPYKECQSCNTIVNKIYEIIRENLIAEACDEVIASTHKAVKDETKIRAKELKQKYGNGKSPYDT